MNSTFIKRLSTTVNWFLCVLFLLPTALLYSLASPTRRGFFCNDQSIALPLKSATVSVGTLFATILIIPAAIIVVTEFILCWMSTRRRTNNAEKDTREKGAHSSKDFVHGVIKAFSKSLGPYYCGLFGTFMLTDVIKFTAGSLRPHFLAVCQPDMKLINCAAGYVENYTCLGSNEWLIAKARLSFPSGHASLSMYAMLATVIYLHLKARPRRFQRLITALQASLICYALFCGFSRIRDNMHHFSDVMVGTVLGGVIAVVSAFANEDLAKRNGIKTTRQKMELESIHST